MVAVCQTYLHYAQAVAPNVRRIRTGVLYQSGIQLAQFRAMLECGEHDATILPKQPGEVWAINDVIDDRQ